MNIFEDKPQESLSPFEEDFVPFLKFDL